RIVEAGVHMGDAGGDVLALAPPEALRFACHKLIPNPKPVWRRRGPGTCRRRRSEAPVAGRPLLLLAGDRPGLALAGARIGVRALAADRQALAMAKPAIAGEVHQPLDVHRRLAAEVAFDLMVGVDRLAE